MHINFEGAMLDTSMGPYHPLLSHRSIPSLVVRGYHSVNKNFKLEIPVGQFRSILAELNVSHRVS